MFTPPLLQGCDSVVTVATVVLSVSLGFPFGRFVCFLVTSGVNVHTSPSATLQQCRHCDTVATVATVVFSVSFGFPIGRLVCFFVHIGYS